MKIYCQFIRGTVGPEDEGFVGDQVGPAYYCPADLPGGAVTRTQLRRLAVEFANRLAGTALTVHDAQHYAGEGAWEPARLFLDFYFGYQERWEEVPTEAEYYGFGERPPAGAERLIEPFYIPQAGAEVELPPPNPGPPAQPPMAGATEEEKRLLRKRLEALGAPEAVIEAKLRALATQ